MSLLEQFSQMHQLTVIFLGILSLQIRNELGMLLLYNNDCYAAILATCKSDY